jgi:Domain of unknown function (DUF4160)
MERTELPIAEGHDRDPDDPEDEFFDMANLFPKHTGLPFVVWISYRGGARHDVRVKVSPGPRALPAEMASIAIRPDIRVVEGSLSSEDLALLAKWIEMNRDTLLRYWEGDIDTKDAIEAIRPIG